MLTAIIENSYNLETSGQEVIERVRTPRHLVVTIQFPGSVEEYERASANISSQGRGENPTQKEEEDSEHRPLLASNTFLELYRLTGEDAGPGPTPAVQTCALNIYTEVEYAVKIIEKVPTHKAGSRVLPEIDLFHHCQGSPKHHPA